MFEFGIRCFTSDYGPTFVSQVKINIRHRTNTSCQSGHQEVVTKLHHLPEDLGAIAIKFIADELQEFRDPFSQIDVAGVRSTESAPEDQ